nr:ABC transporter ATP-binding protein [uncultured Acetatifactor sp.]
MKTYENKSSSNFRYLRRITKDLFTIMPFEISGILFIKILSAVAAFIQVYISAAFFDVACRFFEGTATASELFKVCVVFIAFLAVPFVLELLQLHINDIKIFDKNHAFKDRLLEKIASAPLIEFEDSEFYNKISRANSCVSGNGLLNYFYGFTDFFPTIFRFIGVISVIASFHVAFIPIAVISILPSFVSKWVYNKALYNMKRRQMPLARRRDYLWGVLTGVNTVKELRVLGSEAYFKKIWTDARDECLDQDFKIAMKAADVFLFCDVIKLLGFAASVGLAVYFVSKGNISIGQFSACIAAFGTLQASTADIAGMITDQNKKADYAGDYYDFIDGMETEVSDSSHTQIDSPEHTDIEVRNLCFAYSADTPEVLRNISFTIKSGERVVIVGENGSGKTTLSKLIIGAFEPISGQVLINGIDCAALSREKINSIFSVIQQDFVRYQLSLRENIGLGSPDGMADDLRLLDASKRAGASDIVERVGLDTQLGREFAGAELSGGEWQKVAIARGLNKDAPCIILDEPTSALDPLVENEILSSMVGMTAGKTSVIISHRVGICKYADRIIVLRAGEVAEVGTHAELLQAGGEYARLWNEQAKWYTN